MGKGKLYLAIAIIAVVFIGGIGILSLNTGPLIHGYDGPVAQIVDIEADEYERVSGDNYREMITAVHAEVYIDSPDFLDLLIPAGLRIEIMGAPNVLSTDVIDHIERFEIDEAAGTNTTSTVEVQRVKCSMGVTVSTFRGGLASALQTIFWIQVEENAYSIFSNADDSLAYIVNIYTITEPQEIGSMEYTPTAEGNDFLMESVETHEVPSWVTAAGYQPEAALFEKVKFAVEIFSGVPYMDLWVRQESSVTFDVGIDITLIGHWKQVKDIREWGWPDPTEMDQTWLIILILLALVGVVGSVFIIVRLGPKMHPILLLFFVLLVWVPLFLWISMDLIGKLQEFLGGLT